MPSHQPIAKPARYMSPYQRTASGPIENAMGSMLGCVSTGARLTCNTARVGQEVPSCGAERAAPPREPEVEARMGVGDFAVSDAAPAEIRERRRNDGDAQSARDQAHDGLHLNRLLGDARRETGAPRKPGHDVVQAR